MNIQTAKCETCAKPIVADDASFTGWFHIEWEADMFRSWNTGTSNYCREWHGRFPLNA